MVQVVAFGTFSDGRGRSAFPLRLTIDDEFGSGGKNAAVFGATRVILHRGGPDDARAEAARVAVWRNFRPVTVICGGRVFLERFSWDRPRIFVVIGACRARLAEEESCWKFPATVS